MAVVDTKLSPRLNFPFFLLVIEPPTFPQTAAVFLLLKGMAVWLSLAPGIGAEVSELLWLFLSMGWDVVLGVGVVRKETPRIAAKDEKSLNPDPVVSLWTPWTICFCLVACKRNKLSNLSHFKSVLEQPHSQASEHTQEIKERLRYVCCSVNKSRKYSKHLRKFHNKLWGPIGATLITWKHLWTFSKCWQKKGVSSIWLL